MEASPNRPHLHLINSETGEAEERCPDCINLERQNRALMRQRTALENKLEDKRATEIEATEIVEVLSYWRDRCMLRPASVVFAPGGDRWEKVRDRLADELPGRDGGWTVRELKLAVEGALVSPFHNGTDPKTHGKQYLDAKTIFKNAEVVGSHVDRALKFNDKIRVLPSVFLRAFVGMNVDFDLAVCDCGHRRFQHVQVPGFPGLDGKHICSRCDCGDFWLP